MNKVIAIALVAFSCQLSFSQSWSNPIRSELPSYGFKDCHLFKEGNTFYVLGTQYSNPYTQEKGLHLFQSTNLNEWKEAETLIDQSKLAADCWFKSVQNAPEIRKIKGKYYLTFNGNNEQLRPYKKTGFGIAFAENLNEEFEILNPDKPLFYCNQSSLIEAENGELVVIFEMDGRLYETELDLEKTSIKYNPKEILGPETLGESYRYLDAPNITKIGQNYHLIFSQFYAGYVVKVFHMLAQDPRGPYQLVEDEPLYTWLESEASDILHAQYPSPNYFAPPTQVIFSNQLVALGQEQYGMVYHSSEKYSEPALCIEKVHFKGDSIIIDKPKLKNQKL